MSLLIYFVIKLMKSKGKYRNTDSELFSLQTQIRAELNILRKTYEDVKTSGQRKIQRKHFPEKLYQPSLKERPISPDPRSRSKSAHEDRGKRHLSPVFLTQSALSSSHQRKHFPSKFVDKVVIRQSKSRRPSAYMVDRSKSPKPKNMQSPIEHREGNFSPQVSRPTKKMMSQMHVYKRGLI